MNNILFDLYEAQPYGTSKFHGGGEYIKAVFKYLVENYSNKAHIYVYYNFDSFLDAWVLNLIKGYTIPVFDIKNRSEVKKIIEDKNIDIWYSGIPYHYEQSDVGNNAILKGTIHGLRSIEMPGDRYAYLYSNGKQSIKELVKYMVRERYKKREIKKISSCIRMLDELICDSEHSKYSLIQKYPELNDKKVNVYYAPQKVSALSQRDTEEKPYILLLGGDRWVKNTYRAMQALDMLYTDKLIKNHEVYVVGNVNKKVRARIKNNSHFKELGYVDTEKLEELYRNCELFLYPSLNEGFGLPPLEAMKYGKTCIVSGICSLPEICGEAAYYVNPVDCDEIATRVLCALDQPINPEFAISQFKKILNRESRDIDKLCQFIITK